MVMAVHFRCCIYQVISELDALLEETRNKKVEAEKGTESKMEELTPREEDAKVTFMCS